MFSPHDIMELMYEFTREIDSLKDKSSEDIADFCIELDLPPVEAMHIANQTIKYLKEEGIDDPKEFFPGVFDYLEHNGFIYDEGLGRFRES